MSENITKSPVILAYNNLIKSKKILPDLAQEAVLLKLSELSAESTIYFSGRRSLLDRIFNRPLKNKPRGLYIYGGVGRGKSMLMDLFIENLSKNIPARRVHFHAFMSEIHTRIKQWHDNNESEKNPDVIKYIADEIALDAKLICFDEMQITDIADAMIVGRLFEALMNNDVIMVATSNRHPDELYKNGLQRDRFIPFIEMFKKEMDIIELKSETDYRLAHLKSLSRTYFYPLSWESDEFIEKVFKELTGNNNFAKKVIEVRGRKIVVDKAYGDIGVFTFTSLCDVPLGSEDYIEIAKQFGTVIITNIPKLDKSEYNMAIRFTKLIDELYEHKCKLICTAAAAPNEIYTQGEHSFEFERTASRLIEMQSEQYLEKEHHC